MASQPLPNQNKGPVYHAYLIRIWQENPDAPHRAMAKPVNGEEPMRFASLDALFAYLEAECTLLTPTTDSKGNTNDSK